MKKLNQLLTLFAISATAFGIGAQDTTPVPAPPTPTQSADDVLSISGYYGDATDLNMAQYAKGKSRQLKIDGKTVWELPTFDYLKLQFAKQDLTQYTYLHLDIYAVSEMSGAMKYTIAYGPGYNSLTQSPTPQNKPAAGEWTSFDWDIAATFSNNGKFDLSNINYLVLGDTNRSEQLTFYLGNVYAYGKKNLEPETPVLGDFVADVNGKKYNYDGDGTSATNIEAFIGDELNVNISIANAETLTASFNPEIEYTSADGNISFTVKENCTVSLSATLGEDTKTAAYSFSFVEAPEINYPVYIGTTGYESLAAAMATITDDNPKVIITLAEDVESNTINVGGGSLTAYIDLTIQGKTGSEKITFTTGTNTQSIKVNKGIINLKDLTLESKGQEFTCAIAYFPYVSSFNFENVLFKNFSTTASVIDFSPENKNATSNATGTLTNVWFDNCTVTNESNFNSLISIGRNGYLKLGDDNGPLSIYWPVTCKTIECVGEDAQWSEKATIAFSATPKIKNGVSEQPVILNCAGPGNFVIGGALNPRFYTLDSKPKDQAYHLYIEETPVVVEVSDNANALVHNSRYLFTATVSDGENTKAYGMAYNTLSNSISPASFNLDKNGNISIMGELMEFVAWAKEDANGNKGFELLYDGKGLALDEDENLVMVATENDDVWNLTESGLYHIKSGKYIDVVKTPEEETPENTPEASPARAASIAPALLAAEDMRFSMVDDPASEVKLYTTGNDVITAVREFEIEDENAAVEYYSIQGVRVENPTSGLYIMRRGSKAVKVIL